MNLRDQVPLTDEHEPEKVDPGPVRMQQLEIEESGLISFLTYSIDENQLTIWHTKVPEPLRGKGVGGELVKQAIALAREKNLSLQLLCPFALHYVSRHED